LQKSHERKVGKNAKAKLTSVHSHFFALKFNVLQADSLHSNLLFKEDFHIQIEKRCSFIDVQSWALHLHLVKLLFWPSQLNFFLLVLLENKVIEFNDNAIQPLWRVYIVQHLVRLVNWMQFLIPLKNENVAVLFLWAFEKDFIAFQLNVSFLSRLYSAFSRKKIVTVMLIVRGVLRVIKNGVNQLFLIVFERNVMQGIWR